MRKFILNIFVLIQITGCLLAQKRPLNFTALENWPTIKSPIISNDGKFIAYGVSILNKSENLIVQASDGSWRKNLPEIYEILFSTDSRKAVYKNSSDSLFFLDLKTGNIECISKVVNYRIPLEGDGRWIFYRKTDDRNGLIIHDFTTGEERQLKDIIEYQFDKSCHNILMKVINAKDSSLRNGVLWLDLVSGRANIISKNCQATGFIFDEEGKRAAFFTKGIPNGIEANTLHYYRKGMDSAQILIDSSTEGMAGMYVKGEGYFFSKKGDKLLFEIGDLNASHNSISHNSEKQVFIRNAQNKRSSLNQTDAFFSAAIHLDSGGRKMIRLQQEEDSNPRYFDYNSNWLLTQSNTLGDYVDYKWMVSARPDIYLISSRDGSRRLLKKRLISNSLYFSLSGKYVIWFDREQKQWFSHNTVMNITKSIRQAINNYFYREDDHPDFPDEEEIVGWLENDKGVLIHDRYDIWQMDPEGVKPPINITFGYGARNKIRLRYIEFNEEGHSLPILRGDTLLLSAFEEGTKYDGFFSLIFGSKVLQKLILSPNTYNYRSDDLCGSLPFRSIAKARDASIYMLTRMSPTEYPNLYITSNFHEFNSLTNLAPQKEYNWYTSKLVHWKKFDGRVGEGILYKPENFTPLKKYPIIFYYYEKNAFALNVFVHPQLSIGQMNIPWFVSNGYLVFVPDIYYQIGYPGRSAYNSVVSAAQYLCKMPWVDSRRMGLQGHSFGGFETNYIVSHSSLFAAAAPASAVSNIISIYGEAETGTWYYERRQGRIGATLWQRPDLYVENSPIFKADKVSTPILIMHTQDDTGVPYSQALQWFNELRRLEKKVWLLSYKREDHILMNKKNQLDYSIRLSQFFDHFLKSKPSPKWMTEWGNANQGVGKPFESDANKGKSQ